MTVAVLMRMLKVIGSARAVVDMYEGEGDYGTPLQVQMLRDALAEYEKEKYPELTA